MYTLKYDMMFAVGIYNWWSNQTRPGVFYGQCSEIYGANHSFMLIVIEAVSLDKWWYTHMDKTEPIKLTL